MEVVGDEGVEWVEVVEGIILERWSKESCCSRSASSSGSYLESGFCKGIGFVIVEVRFSAWYWQYVIEWGGVELLDLANWW